MAELTPEQAQQIQALAANVEVAWREVNRSKTALSYLIQVGRATCSDVKTYNLIAKSTYFYQKSMADLIRGAGGNAPAVPELVYVSWKGRTGDQAVDIDCGQAQMQGWQPDGLGDYYVNPEQVEWKFGPTPGDVMDVQRVLSGVNFANKPSASELGAAPLVVIGIILVGVIIAVAAYAVLKMVEAFTGLPQRIEQTKQTAIAAERHRATLEARQKCLADCAVKGKDPIACAKSCARVLPDFKAPGGGSSMGILGWILGLVIVGGLGYLGYRALRGRGRYLPDKDDDDDGVDGVGDYIDAEYVEH